MADNICVRISISAEQVAGHMAACPDFLAAVLGQLRSASKLVHEAHRNRYLAEFGQAEEITGKDKGEIAFFLRELVDALEEEG